MAKHSVTSFKIVPWAKFFKLIIFKSNNNTHLHDFRIVLQRAEVEVMEDDLRGREPESVTD